MNTYDKIALSNRPTLYISAPENTDKSGTGDFTLTNNNLSASGQPIIFGNEFSFLMNDTNTVDVVGNPIFFNSNANFECVIFAGRPNQELPILIDDLSNNSLLLTPDGITLKLFFDNSTSTYAKTATVNIKDWSKKFYIVLSITSTQATLAVNGESEILDYSDEIVQSSNITIGGGYTGFHYLIDGIGFYNKTVLDKSGLINDAMSGYSTYAAVGYNGTTTRFDGYTSGYVEVFDLDDFLYSNDQYILIYYVTAIQGELDYISVKANDERVTVAYDIDLDDSGEFTDYLLLSTVTDSTIRFIVNAVDVEQDFSLRIEGISSADIINETPANLDLTGLALYGIPAESIVNCPDGTKLIDSAYLGTWTISDVMPDTPKTVEIVFKPTDDTEDTVVFASSDGSVTYGPTGAVTGFTAYLNGQLVTDLTDLRYGQWNHLVLIHATPAATQFYLNSDDGLPAGTEITYMLLTAYPDELEADQVITLYEILSGIDGLNISESITITEGTFPGGQSFNSYSYTWAIVGAGGT